MGIRSNLTSQFRQVPPDHIEPDFYIDSNICTLHDVVQQLAIDSQSDTPLMTWLLEHPHSPIALPGKIDLYGHDCLHAILNRGHSLADEAFIRGFTMGNDLQTTWLHKFLYKIAASTVYPKKYRFSWKDLKFFDAGFVYGRSIQRRNLNQLDFSTYQNHAVLQVRQQLEISKAAEIELLQFFSSPL
ncbi:hypothetical protein [Leptolyngbya sp. FACHB-8]|uniref:hypothetical protein n=1 Tax=unclassified Leptolyngbya TaxID=2650499 RepID=UPI00168A21A6|nr:hypothetical protein [Leptolyngbya sp. FACHB-8]MBD1913248.1 hypothetical protein [Leptolyngbya sp. FACHB-8]